MKCKSKYANTIVNLKLVIALNAIPSIQLLPRHVHCLRWCLIRISLFFQSKLNEVRKNQNTRLKMRTRHSWNVICFDASHLQNEERRTSFLLSASNDHEIAYAIALVGNWIESVENDHLKPKKLLWFPENKMLHPIVWESKKQTIFDLFGHHRFHLFDYNKVINKKI